MECFLQRIDPIPFAITTLLTVASIVFIAVTLCQPVINGVALVSAIGCFSLSCCMLLLRVDVQSTFSYDPVPP